MVNKNYEIRKNGKGNHRQANSWILGKRSPLSENRTGRLHSAEYLVTDKFTH